MTNVPRSAGRGVKRGDSEAPANRTHSATSGQSPTAQLDVEEGKGLRAAGGAALPSAGWSSLDPGSASSHVPGKLLL